MIRVNLLPLEYRKAEATPLKQFFATVGAVVLAVLAATAWAWVYFALFKDAEQKNEQLVGEIASQKSGLDLTQRAETRVNELKAQCKLIDDVAKRRVVWSRKFDEMWEVVVTPRTPGRYEVWLDNLTAQTSPAGPTAAVGGTLGFAGNSAGPQLAKLTDFHEDLSTSPFFSEFQSLNPPSGNRTTLPGKDRDPAEGWTFNLTLQLRKLQDISDARAKAAGTEGTRK